MDRNVSLKHPESLHLSRGDSIHCAAHASHSQWLNEMKLYHEMEETGDYEANAVYEAPVYSSSELSTTSASSSPSTDESETGPPNGPDWATERHNLEHRQRENARYAQRQMAMHKKHIIKLQQQQQQQQQQQEGSEQGNIQMQQQQQQQPEGANGMESDASSVISSGIELPEQLTLFTLDEAEAINEPVFLGSRSSSSDSSSVGEDSFVSATSSIIRKRASAAASPDFESIVTSPLVQAQEPQSNTETLASNGGGGGGSGYESSSGEELDEELGSGAV
eukprot:UC1_evm1s231